MIITKFFMIASFLWFLACDDRSAKKATQKSTELYRWSNGASGHKICMKKGKTKGVLQEAPLQKCIDLGIGKYEWVKNSFGVKSCVYQVNGGVSNPVPINKCETSVFEWVQKLF